MNKKQARLLNDVIKKYQYNTNKINEFNQKFFNERDGVLREDNPRFKGGLSVGVYVKNTGQSIDISMELLPVVIDFVKKLQSYYKEENERISVDDLIWEQEE